MAETLRERLAPIIEGTIAAVDPFRTSRQQRRTEVENRTDEALTAVADWLREEADQRRSFAYNNAGNDYLLDEAVVVESLADAIAAEEADRG